VIKRLSEQKRENWEEETVGEAYGKVRIFGLEQRIELFEKNSPCDGAMGRSIMNAGLITLEQDLPPDQFEETLLHEVVHLVADNSAIELSEQAVAALSLGLFSAGIRVPVEREPRVERKPLDQFEDHGVQNVFSKNPDLNAALNRINDLAKTLNLVIDRVNEIGRGR